MSRKKPEERVQFTLRLPKSLRDRLALLAHADSVSLNDYMLNKFESEVGADVADRDAKVNWIGHVNHENGWTP